MRVALLICSLFCILQVRVYLEIIIFYPISKTLKCSGYPDVSFSVQLNDDFSFNVILQICSSYGQFLRSNWQVQSILNRCAILRTLLICWQRYSSHISNKVKFSISYCIMEFSGLKENPEIRIGPRTKSCVKPILQLKADLA